MRSSSPFEGARLRANPGYELVLLDSLPDAKRVQVEQEGDDELYGVLRGRPGSRLEPRTASSDTALLFMTLAAPKRLPRYVRARLGDETEPVVTRLVLDGVLEVEHAGTFVSGADAAPVLLTRRAGGGRGRIGELSEAALRYGQELTALPHALLADRLYGYGTLPLSPRLRRRLGGDAAVASACGLRQGDPAQRSLARGWVEPASAEGHDPYWRHWRRRPAPDAGRPADTTAYKLYVSPTLDGLPDAVAAVAETLADVRGVFAFKLGRDVRGICRPDKLVVYFDRLDDLREGAARLRDRLAGCPGQGVPFTAAVTEDGLLSWGVDPPSTRALGVTSWRRWVAERLAEHLAHAAAGHAGPAGGERPPWQFALDRLRLSGVDTDSWIPASTMWADALASE
ncbi:MAG TPA: hypothetical protein VHF89_11135 [Solirubrobacteraceae bacterium]|nr:hypothetical protein [Solirubrobacteraceae bacterium]